MPDKERVRARVKKLRELLLHHAHQYYSLDAPTISDDAYDALHRELVELETQYPELATSDSVTQRVVGEALPELKKVSHRVEQWSFDNAFLEDDIKAFDARVKRMLKKTLDRDESLPVAYDLELKIDGLKIVFTYEKGKLVSAVTRGDGVVGEDVTHNVRTIRSIRERLSRPVDVIVEGEVYLTISGFSTLNKERLERGEPLFANPRNAAAGSIRQLDPNIAATRPLAAFIYDLAQSSEAIPQTQSEEILYIKELGLPINEEHSHTKDLSDVFSYWRDWQGEKRKSVDYQIDGIVLKVEDRAYQEALGYTGKSPRFAIAWKFPPEQVHTIVEDITLQVGRTGKLTPVAHLRPVSVAGSTVARATLHNEDFILERDIRIGDTVVLQKAGDVIPEIVSVIKELRPKSARKWHFPARSTLCGGDGSTERIPGEAAHRCKVAGSFEQQMRRLIHFAGKHALDIDGLGRETVKLLMENALISDFDDIFELTREELINLPSFEEQKTNNLLKGIVAAKTVSFDRLLVGLSIPHVGEETARLLASNFKTPHLLKKAGENELSSIEGVGPIIGASVKRWFQDKNNLDLLGRLLKHLSVQEVVAQANGPLSLQTVVVTGTLPTLSREEAESLIRKAGGRAASTVSTKTSFVVAGDAAGSKLTRARELGIPVINEEAFLKRLEA